MKHDIELTDDHRYIIDDKNEVPSVTTIIKEIIGYAFYADQWYLDRGTVVHACAKLIADKKEFTYDDQVAGYVEAIYKFFREIKPIVKYAEVPVYSHHYKYAGTIDLVARISGYNCICDYKNSLDLYRLKLQLEAYSIGLFESHRSRANYGFGIVLNENGNYKMTDRINLLDMKLRREWLALRTVYGMKERLGLIKKEE